MYVDCLPRGVFALARLLRYNTRFESFEARKLRANVLDRTQRRLAIAFDGIVVGFSDGLDY